jgi:hypothetical protein
MSYAKMPPPDLIVQRKELRDALDGYDADIQNHLHAIEGVREKKADDEKTLAALDLILNRMYDYKGEEWIVKIPQTTPPLSTSPKFSRDEYWNIIAPSLKKGALAPIAMRRIVKEKTGIEVSEAAMSKMARRMSQDPKYPMRKIQDGLYAYDESKLTQQPSGLTP